MKIFKMAVLQFFQQSCLGHTRSRDYRIARLVTNLRDLRLVATTKDQIYLRFTVNVNVSWKNAFNDWL